MLLQDRRVADNAGEDVIGQVRGRLTTVSHQGNPTQIPTSTPALLESRPWAVTRVGEKLGKPIPHTRREGTQDSAAAVGNGWAAPQMVRYRPRTLPLGADPGAMRTEVHARPPTGMLRAAERCTSPKRPSTRDWADKRACLSYNGVLSGHKKNEVPEPTPAQTSPGRGGASG